MRTVPVLIRQTMGTYRARAENALLPGGVDIETLAVEVLRADRALWQAYVNNPPQLRDMILDGVKAHLRRYMHTAKVKGRRVWESMATEGGPMWKPITVMTFPEAEQMFRAKDRQGLSLRREARAGLKLIADGRAAGMSEQTTMGQVGWIAEEDEVA